MRQVKRFEPSTKPSGLLEFIPQVSPHLVAPTWLEPVAKALESITGQPRFIILNVPPQHGKTTLLMHFIAWVLTQQPHRRIVYVSYEQTFAEGNTKQARAIMQRLGVPLSPDMNTKKQWDIEQHGGGLYTTSIGGGITGKSVDIGVIDDPIKGYADSLSAATMRKTRDWYDTEFETRLNNHSSAILLMTRWQKNDLAGYLQNKYGDKYQTIRIPALADELDAYGKTYAPDPLGRVFGEALFPEFQSRQKLEDYRKVNPNKFRAMHQGLPEDAVDKIFRGVWYYDALPNHLQWAIGVDLQYTEQDKADESVIVVMAVSREGLFYVPYVETWRGEIYTSVARLKSVQARFPQARAMYVEANGPQKVAAQVLHREGVKVVPIESVVNDKGVRAQLLSADWNRGRVLMPNPAIFKEVQSWLEHYLERLDAFTGLANDVLDDQVDASVWAHKALIGSIGKSKLQHSRQIR